MAKKTCQYCGKDGIKYDHKYHCKEWPKNEEGHPIDPDAVGEDGSGEFDITPASETETVTETGEPSTVVEPQKNTEAEPAQAEQPKPDAASGDKLVMCPQCGQYPVKYLNVLDVLCPKCGCFTPKKR